MSTAKINRIVGSSTALPEVDGLMTRQAITASSNGQTRFNVTLFNDDVKIRAFVSDEEVDVSWVDGVAVLEEGVVAGTQVDFYGFGDRIVEKDLANPGKGATMVAYGAGTVADFLDFLQPWTTATVAETIEGSDNVKAVTPFGLAALTSSTDRRGLISNATVDETITGEDPHKAVSPAGLASLLTSLTATDSRRGLIETATPQEVITGTDGERAVTPAGLAGLTATTTRRGLVELATDAETSGTSATFAVTPAGLNARDDAKTYTSSDFTITPNSPLSLTHGLGVIPKSVQVLLICQTAELGYSPGDVVDVSGYHGNNDSSTSSGITMKLTATDIDARIFSSFYIGNFDTGSLATATAANWHLRIRAFA